MARVTFDTNDPEDVKLMHRMVAAGLLEGTELAASVDLDQAVDSLLSSLGDTARELVIEFMFQTEGRSVKLATIAESMNIPESEVKSRKMGLGRSVKRVQREFPGLPDIIIGEVSKTPPQRMAYTMDSSVRDALDRWFQARGRDFRKPAKKDETPDA